MPVLVVHAVVKLSLGQVFLIVLRFFPVIIVPPLLLALLLLTLCSISCSELR